MGVVGPVQRIEALPTAPELGALVRLRHAEGPVIARRLAETLGRSRAAVSETPARPEVRGFVERRPSPAKGRAAPVTSHRVSAGTSEIVSASSATPPAEPRECGAGGGLAAPRTATRNAWPSDRTGDPAASRYPPSPVAPPQVTALTSSTE
ncbi:MarR family transcriptional regulator [Streptomyces caniscabiei]|uniref:MarR family transcriptional regulator n=1 Tax=Streptomyces caniscabiei TaxID=2746961 RepID=UPI000D1BD622|nr:helix-turn-helix domain-containing protein [Streptomyces caniscabiei]